MKSVFAKISLLALSFVVFGCSAGIPNRPDKLGLETPRFSIPEPSRFKLSNGLEVYYYHNPELPVMRARLYIEGGSLRDSFGIPGLASATGSQLREGGTKGFTPDELDSYLDRMAASIESGMSDEYSTVSLFCLAEDFEQLFKLFATVVRYPSFSAERLSLQKALALEQISRRKDDPSTIGTMLFTELLYGRGSKFADYSTIESIQKITRPMLKKYHRANYVPEHAKLAISGSIAESEVKAAIEDVFGDWQPLTKSKDLGLPALSVKSQPGIYLVERDLDQATIAIGHLGPPRHTDDFYAIRVFSEIFGSGGFSSTLFQEIRTKRGLAYSVYGGIWPDVVAGTFQIGLQTRKEQAISAVTEVLSISKQVRIEPPSDKDFQEAQSSVERSFVFKFAKPESIVDRAVMLDTLKYPSDFDAKYLDRIAAVSQEQVRNSAKRWIDPKKVVVVIVGKVDKEELAKSFPDLPIYEVEFDMMPGKITKVHSDART